MRLKTIPLNPVPISLDSIYEEFSMSEYATQVDRVDALVLALADARADVRTMADMVVMSFDAEETPLFTQGFQSHEMLSVVTAEQCNNMARIIQESRQKCQSTPSIAP